MSQRVYIYGWLIRERGGAAGKPSVNSASIVVYVRPETRLACPDQVELWVKPE